MTLHIDGDTQGISKNLPLVSLITVNFNQALLTCALIDSVLANSYKNIEVIVVDNGSKENPVALFSSKYPQVKCIRSEQNLGFAGGNNLGIAEAKGTYLFLVNNDAELTNGCLELLLDAATKNSKLGAISPMICFDEARNQPQGDLIQYCGSTTIHALTARNETIGAGEHDNGQYQTLSQTAYCHGAAMFVPKSVLANVGLMNDEFFLYYEELDWCARMRKAGYELYVEPKAKVYHKESVSVGPESPLKTYFLNRNRIFFMRRNYSWLSVLVFLAFLLAVTIPVNLFRFISTGRTKHAKAFLQAILWNLKNSLTGSIQNPSWLPSLPKRVAATTN